MVSPSRGILNHFSSPALSVLYAADIYTIYIVREFTSASLIGSRWQLFMARSRSPAA